MPFALPAMSPSSRSSKASLPPFPHQLGSMGMPTAANAAAYPLGQGTSVPEVSQGHNLVLPQGQDQRPLHPMDSQGGADGVVTSTGSHEVADRYATSLCTQLDMEGQGCSESAHTVGSGHHNKVHNGSRTMCFRYYGLVKISPA